jgi:Putative Ig domain
LPNSSLGRLTSIMKRSILILSSFCILSLLFLITACGGGAFSSTGNGNGGGGTTSNPSVTTSSIPAGTVGSAYAASLQATGGKTPYKWSLKSGTLPAGVSLSAAGAIGGIPTAAGTDSLVFEVTDADKNSASSRNLSLMVKPEVPPVVLTSGLQSGNVGVAYAATLTATGGTKPYTWSVKSGTLPDGLYLDSTTGAIGGTPTQPGTSNSLVFVVTDFYNSVGASGNLSVKIDPVVQVSTTSLPNGTQGSAYTGYLRATGGSGVYTWSLKSGSLPPGLSLNPSTGAITGTPTTANIFNRLVFEATDADTATGVSGPLSVQVYNPAGCSAGAESNLGTQPYAFLIKGFDPTTTNLAPMTMIGSFTPDGRGGITEGEDDTNSPSGAQSDLTIIPANSSYSLGPDNNGCLALATSAGTANFHFSVSTPNGSNMFTKGHIMLDDSSGTGARGTGILRLQDPSAFAAGLTGMYAFLFAGTDAASGNVGVAGSFTAGGGNFANLALDADDAGSLLSSVTGGNGTYSSTDTCGRGTASFAAIGSGYDFSLDSVYYVVSSAEVLFASTDSLTTNPISSGQAFATNSTLFSAAYLTNSYVAHGMGLAAGDAPAASIMTGVFDGVSTGGGWLTQDHGGIVSSWLVNISYSVDATTGRVVFTGNAITPVGYLVTGFGGMSAVLVGNDFPATSGTLEPQQANPQPASGIYSIGTDEDVDYLTANLVGTLNLSSANFSGTENLSNAASPFLLENETVSNSFSFTGNGTGSFWGNDAVSTGSVIYFITEEAGANTHPAIISVTK